MRPFIAALALSLLISACSDSDGNPVAPGSSSSDPLIYFVPSKSCTADIKLVVTVDGTEVAAWEHFSTEKSVHIHPGLHTIIGRDGNNRNQLVLDQKLNVTTSTGLGVACL